MPRLLERVNFSLPTLFSMSAPKVPLISRGRSITGPLETARSLLVASSESMSLASFVVPSRRGGFRPD